MWGIIPSGGGEVYKQYKDTMYIASSTLRIKGKKKAAQRLPYMER